MVVGGGGGGMGGLAEKGARAPGGPPARLAAEASKPKVSAQFGSSANEHWELEFVRLLKEVAVGLSAQV